MSTIRLAGPCVVTELHFDEPTAFAAGSSLVIAELCGRLIMVFNKARTGWEFPGGKALPGEEAADCARREFKEETGLVLEHLKPYCTFRVDKSGEIHEGTIFAGCISSFSPNINSKEILGIGLFTEPPPGISIKDGYIELMFNRIIGY